MSVSEKLKMLPHLPGVYRFLDGEGNIIYVGKAKDLKNRVSQYFRPVASLNRKTAVMVSKICDIRHTIVDSEADAFLLENNLIKQFQPRYNILLKDGKTYPWICVKNEPFPRVVLTRKFKKDGSRYFGPYSSVQHANGLLSLINSMFRLRTCRLPLSPSAIKAGKFKVCLNYHIDRCGGACVGKVSLEEYDGYIRQVIGILKGNTYSLIKEYERKMAEAAAELRYEQAQEYKEKMELLERHYAKSLVVNSRQLNVDVFAIIPEGDCAFGNFMRVCHGCIVQSVNMEIRPAIEEGPASVLSAFIAGIYARLGEAGETGTPDRIVVPFMPDMDDRRLTVPEKKGDLMSLLELSRKNAAAMKFEKLKQEEITSPQEHSARVMENLMRDLGMDVLPRHIECFDNSNIQGTNPVASCVVFRDAVPSKKDYRHFNIKTVVGANDFASMKEVVGRRYSRLLREGGDLPQLVVIDGGKGQVSSACEALEELGLSGRIKLIGIAKRMEELIIPGDPWPMFLDRNSTSLRLIMQLRDEAHRFGITHHRNRRSSSALRSELDGIPGVGAVSREKLLTRYRTVSKIRQAPYSEIVNVIGRRSANALFSYFGLPVS